LKKAKAKVSHLIERYTTGVEASSNVTVMLEEETLLTTQNCRSDSIITAIEQQERRKQWQRGKSIKLNVRAC
jgi:hypothetical protein